jgi:hypothetical protein
VCITVFFVDHEPVDSYDVTVAARCTPHLRFNNLKDPSPMHCDTDSASVFESNVPIVLQHTRLDSRHADVQPAFNNGLLQRRGSTCRPVPVGTLRS